MKICLTIDDRSATATLIDSPTTRDFLSLLLLTLTLEDYAGIEKIAYLPSELSNEGAPDGIDPTSLCRNRNNMYPGMQVL